PSYRPATEADIYAAFKAEARLENFFFEDPGKPFGPDMTLKDWDDAANDFYDVNFAYMFKWLSDTYQIKLSEALWRELISDPAKTTVRDVCRFTAKHGALMLDPKPLRVAGRDCAEAGAFLTLRSAMNQLSKTTCSFAPSATIDHIARSHPIEFHTCVYQICPQVLNNEKSKSAWPLAVTEYAWLAMFPLGLVSLLVSMTGLGLPTISWKVWLGSVSVLTIASMFLSALPPRRIEIIGLKSMADLSREIVKQQRGLSQS
ncbi:MAG: hypothetical protein R3C45_00015, partial [Phycisphaerales bacterium]